MRAGAPVPRRGWIAAAAGVALALSFAAPVDAVPRVDRDKPSRPKERGRVKWSQQNGQALRVFLDCERFCDFDYLRRTITFVDYVRDRQDAQVHVLVTIQRTAAGTEASLRFIGLQEFSGIEETVPYSSSRTDTDDEQRAGFARVLAQGLVRYVIGTPLGDQIEVRHDPGDGEDAIVAARPEDDPWNFWVFRVRGGVEMDFEERQDSVEFDSFLSANRTTEKWKIQVGANGEYQRENFEFDSGETLRNTSRTLGIGGQVVRSVGPRWGIGVGGALAASTFNNLDPSLRVAAAVEHNIYPYSESSERELRITYFLGVTRFNFEEETIFRATEETRGDQGLILSLDLNRPWGEAGFDAEASHFLSDFGQHRLELRSNLEYRIFRGLSVDVRGNASLVRDQIFLPRRGATDAEILLERRALATDFEYSIEFGLSYTFGSIFNNVVNSRFTGTSGGFHRILGVGGGGGGGGGGPG